VDANFTETCGARRVGRGADVRAGGHGRAWRRWWRRHAHGRRRFPWRRWRISRRQHGRLAWWRWLARWRMAREPCLACRMGGRLGRWVAWRALGLAGRLGLARRLGLAWLLRRLLAQRRMDRRDLAVVGLFGFLPLVGGLLQLRQQFQLRSLQRLLHAEHL